MVLEILKGNQGSLEELNLCQSGFSTNLGNAICQALSQSQIQLVSLNLSENPTWFDTYEKCVTWASVFT